ncbi:hypothetical protein IWW48_002485 [Coemansia sp. RSA 1200]|nr:hypothetical protein IWW48_002485 [Coemansia sp. RSA 1200]
MPKIEIYVPSYVSETDIVQPRDDQAERTAFVRQMIVVAIVNLICALVFAWLFIYNMPTTDLTSAYWNMLRNMFALIAALMYFALYVGNRSSTQDERVNWLLLFAMMQGFCLGITIALDTTRVLLGGTLLALLSLVLVLGLVTASQWKSHTVLPDLVDSSSFVAMLLTMLLPSVFGISRQLAYLVLGVGVVWNLLSSIESVIRRHVDGCYVVAGIDVYIHAYLKFVMGYLAASVVLSL